MCCTVTNCCGCNTLQSGCVKLGITNIVFACLGLLSLSNGVSIATIVWYIAAIGVNAALIYGAK